jgi:hypothetical protein
MTRNLSKKHVSNKDFLLTGTQYASYVVDMENILMILQIMISVAWSVKPRISKMLLATLTIVTFVQA